MGIDLLVLDDDHVKLDLVRKAATEYELECLTFTSGVEALNYIRSKHNGELPKGYLIDMKINGEDDNISKEIFFELEGRINKRDLQIYFRFFTGHYSDHDEAVEAETNATVIVKGEEVVQALHEYMQTLKTEKEKLTIQSQQ